MKTHLRRIRKQGTTLPEYCLIFALIAVVSVIAISGIGTVLNQQFLNLDASILQAQYGNDSKELEGSRPSPVTSPEKQQPDRIFNPGIEVPRVPGRNGDHVLTPEIERPQVAGGNGDHVLTPDIERPQVAGGNGDRILTPDIDVPNGYQDDKIRMPRNAIVLPPIQNEDGNSLESIEVHAAVED